MPAAKKWKVRGSPLLLKSLHQILMERMIHGMGWFNLCIINDDIGRVKLSEGHRLWTEHSLEASSSITDILWIHIFFLFWHGTVQLVLANIFWQYKKQRINAWVCDVKYKACSCSQSMNSREQVAARKSGGIFWFILFFRTNATNIWQNSCDYDNNAQLRKNWYYLGNIKYCRLQEYKWRFKDLSLHTMSPKPY